MRRKTNRRLGPGATGMLCVFMLNIQLVSIVALFRRVLRYCLVIKGERKKCCRCDMEIEGLSQMLRMTTRVASSHSLFARVKGLTIVVKNCISFMLYGYLYLKVQFTSLRAFRRSGFASRLILLLRFSTRLVLLLRFGSRLRGW